jgi:hypothetical protein
MVPSIVVMLVVHGFLQTASSMLMGLTLEVLTPSVKAILSLQSIG